MSTPNMVLRIVVFLIVFRVVVSREPRAEFSNKMRKAAIMKNAFITVICARPGGMDDITDGPEACEDGVDERRDQRLVRPASADAKKAPEIRALRYI